MSHTENNKIVFFGTPEFAVESLNALLETGHNVAAVVTMPDKIAGRGHKLIESDVKKYAVSKGLRLLQPVNLKDENFLKELREIDASLFVIIAFRMLPKSVWQMPPLGTFNLHASLLPKYRGAAPINRAVMNGDTETGVTTFFLQHEIDTGDIIEQKKIKILPEDNVGTVYDRLMKLGAGMVVSTVDKIFDGSVTSSPQPSGEYTPAPKIFAEDCILHWKNKTESIHNQVRGLSPYPGARCSARMASHAPMEIKVFSTSLTDMKADDAYPGSVKISDGHLYVACADMYIELLELQPSGKKRMPASAFLLGYTPEQFIVNEDN